GRAGRDFPAQKIGCSRAKLWAANTGDGGHKVRAGGGYVADGRAAVAVADQVYLGLAADGDDLFDLIDQFFTTGFRTVQLADFGDVHAGAVAAQRGWNAVPVINPQQALKTEQAVGQHDRVAGLGVAGSAEQPRSLGVSAQQQAGNQAGNQAEGRK